MNGRPALYAPGTRDALYQLDAARARFLNAARLMADGTRWTIGDPLVVLIVSRRDIRAARRALRAAGSPIPARPRTRHAK